MSEDPSNLIDCRSAPRRPINDPDLTHDWTPQHYRETGTIYRHYCPDCLTVGPPKATLCPDRVAHVVAEVRRLREDLADLADLRANVNALGRLLSAPDSPLPADIRALVKPGASIVLSARDLLLDVARERDEARAALQSARRSHRADLLTIGAVVGLPEGEADIGYICDRIQRTQAEVRAARVAGARVMQVEAVRVCTMVADHSVGLHTEPGPVGARMASREIRTLDPAAVVGSGS